MSQGIREMREIVVGLVSTGLFFFAGASVKAQDFGPNTYAQYGHATNGYTGTNGGNAEGNNVNGPYCSATSIANSLQFLANKYGGVYDNLLQNSSASRTAVQATRDAIVDDETLSTGPIPNPNPPPATLGNYSGTGSDGSPPVTNQTIWNSKVEYINGQIDPSLIKIEGMIDPAYGLTGYDTPANTDLTFSTPSEDWLQEQVEAGQDVEISFTWLSPTNEPTNQSMDAATPQAHTVTLAGIDSSLDEIEYLDPNAPGAFIDAPFTLQAGTGDLQFLWNNGGNLPANVTVNQAWSESVVPEPTTASLLLLGASFLGTRRVRRQPA
jgi:hypothetical protein